MEKQLEALKEASQYILKLYNGIEVTIDCVKNKELGKAYNLVAQIAEGIQWLYDVFSLTQEVQIEKIDVNNLKHVCESIIEAIINKDNNLLVDLLEFEMIDGINYWNIQLDKNLSYYNS